MKYDEQHKRWVLDPADVEEVLGINMQESFGGNISNVLNFVSLMTNTKIIQRLNMLNDIQKENRIKNNDIKEIMVEYIRQIYVTSSDKWPDSCELLLVNSKVGYRGITYDDMRGAYNVVEPNTQ